MEAINSILEGSVSIRMDRLQQELGQEWEVVSEIMKASQMENICRSNRKSFAKCPSGPRGLYKSQQ